MVRLLQPGHANLLKRQVKAPKIYFRDTGLLQSLLGIRSEALLKLDFGAGRLPGMLALGAEDPHQFKPTHATDLLAFFAGVFERTMRRWLS